MFTKIKLTQKNSTSIKDQEQVKQYKKPLLNNLGDLRSVTLGSSVLGPPDSPITPGKEYIFS